MATAIRETDLNSLVDAEAATLLALLAKIAQAEDVEVASDWLDVYVRLKAAAFRGRA